MNKLIPQIQPILKDAEVTQIVLNHYQNESQTLATDAEANMLKLKELMELNSNEEAERWEEIKKTFVKNKMIKGLGDRSEKVFEIRSKNIFPFFRYITYHSFGVVVIIKLW